MQIKAEIEIVTEIETVIGMTNWLSVRHLKSRLDETGWSSLRVTDCIVSMAPG
jgi:hypothetical protein